MSDRTRRWLSWAAVAIIAALLSTFLGRWQYSRHEAKVENVELVEANFDAHPGSLDDILDGGVFRGDKQWFPVEVSGHYVGEPVILPQRGIPGQAGDHVLSLFVTDSDEPQTLIIDRGWYPISQAPDILDPTDETVTLVGRARPAEPASPRGVRENQVFAVDAAQVIEAQGPVDSPNVQATVYLMADADQPGQEHLGSFPRPSTNLGNNLSYAFQWWIFAVGSFVGLGVVIRRDIKSTSTAPVRRKRVSRDIEEEDALIDAQLGE